MFDASVTNQTTYELHPELRTIEKNILPISREFDSQIDSRTTPNFHPNSPLSRSNSRFRRDQSVGRPEVEEARLEASPSITKIREIRRASNTLSFLPSIMKLEGTGGRTEGVRAVKMECGGNCGRVLE